MTAAMIMTNSQGELVSLCIIALGLVLILKELFYMPEKRIRVIDNDKDMAEAITSIEASIQALVESFDAMYDKLKGDVQQVKTAQRASQKRERQIMHALGIKKLKDVEIINDADVE